MIVIKILLLVIVAFVLYGAFFGGEDEFSDEFVVSELSGGELGVLEQQIGSELLALLLELEEINLDTSIFDSQVFRGLTDFGQELIPQPIGRPNPFAPIGTNIVVPAE